MRLVFIWSGLLCLVMLATFPGAGPGIDEHPAGFREVIVDRVQSFWMSLKTAYLWFMDHSDELYDLIDWTLDCILKERISGKQGMKREELRRKILNTFGNILVIAFISAGSFKMFRRAIKKSFYEELKFRQGKRQSNDFLRGWLKNFNVNLNTSKSNNGARRSRVKRRYHSP